MSAQPQAMNISQLAKMHKIDRATVLRRLERAGVAPVRTRRREKQFDLNQAINAIGDHAAQPDSSGSYGKARTQKVTAEAARLLLKLQRERNQLAPVSELKEAAYSLIKAMHQRLTRYPREARGKLFKAQTAGELERIMSRDIAQIFQDLKNNWPAI